MPDREVFARPVTYEVTIWPDDIECIDSDTWKLTVQYRGRGRWAVNRGPFCLNADGEMSIESISSDRSDEWLAEYRFSFDDALALARERAPFVTINGMEACEVLAGHQLRHPDGQCHA